MVSSGMLRRVAFVRTDVSEELSASFIRVTRTGELGATLAVTSNRRTLRRNTEWETSVLTRATWRNIPEDTILHSHRGENLKSSLNSFVQRVQLCERRIVRWCPLRIPVTNVRMGHAVWSHLALGIGLT
jgi:hypothetical protein